jgi:hypothetical protein
MHNSFCPLSVHTFAKPNARTDRTGNLWDSLWTSAAALKPAHGIAGPGQKPLDFSLPGHIIEASDARCERRGYPFSLFVGIMVMLWVVMKVNSLD